MNPIIATEIGKHPQLIKKAQSDLQQIDVLVCGTCHKVFNFVEDFSAHKDEKCNPEEISTNPQNTLPKVWAFILWKTTQDIPEGEHNNVWKLYQKWIKLENSLRSTWEVAGKTIMSYSRIAGSNSQEMPVKIRRSILDGEKFNASISLQQSPNNLNNKDPQDSKLARMEMSDHSETDFDSKHSSSPTVKKTAQNTVVKVEPKSGLECRIAFRTNGDNDVTENILEKILARRITDKKYEYLARWEDLAAQQTTWEPIQHFSKCMHLISEFEVQLAKQKLNNQVVEKPVTKPIERKKFVQTKASTTITPIPSIKPSVVPNSNRGVRSSKVKALNQVKQWCADEESDKNNRKRKFVDSDYDDTEEQDDYDDVIITNNINDRNKYVKPVNSLSTASSKIITTLANSNNAGKSCQIGNVSIVQVQNNSTNSKSIKTGALPKRALVNGTSHAKPKIHLISNILVDKTQAELIISNPRDGFSCGVFKKEIASKFPKTDGKVKFVIGNENRGIFKTSSPNNNVVRIQRPDNSGSAKPKTIIRRKIVVQRPPPLSNMIQPTSISQVREQSRKYTASLQQQNSTRPTTQAIVKPTITRIIKNQPKSKNIPLDPRIISLAKNGNLQIIKKSPPKPQRRPYGALNSHTYEEDDDSVPDPFPREILPPPPASPPRPLTLCPFTGNVLSRAEGETTPEPSPPPQITFSNDVKNIDQNIIEQQFKHENNDEVEQIIMQEEEEHQDVELLLQQEYQKQQQLQQGEQVGAIQIQLQNDVSEDEPIMQTIELMHQPKMENTEIEQFVTNEDGSPIIVTGQDGIIYQVAGKNSEGDTILIAQGVDGEQNCVIVPSNELGIGDDTSLSLDTVVADAVAHMIPDQNQMVDPNDQQQFILTEGNGLVPGTTLTINTNDDGPDAQITAEFVQADCPSPGGTRKVILLLPDGRLMMTEVNEEQYQALNLAA